MDVGDADDTDDAPAFRLPPPPDDRLWRHPSELGWALPPRRTRTWPLAVVSGLTGAVLTVGLLAVTGVLDEERPTREVIVREAVRPARSTGNDVVRIAAEVAPAIVRLEVSGEEDSVGSGVLFRDDGHVLTNTHVVDGAKEVKAVLADGRTLTARVVGVDPDTDIALVKLDGDGPFPTAVLGSTDSLAVGQPAIAIGSPLGLVGTASVTTGVVSAVGREIVSEGGSVLLDMIQTDAAIASGSSGGALLDDTGAVVGITTAYAVSDVGAEGLGFATPVEVARSVADDLLELGRVRTVWVGVRGEVPERGVGVTIAELLDGGPAGLAGLRVGDVIRRIDDRPITSMSTLRIALRRHHPGDRVDLVYERAGRRRTATVVLAERPPDDD